MWTFRLVRRGCTSARTSTTPASRGTQADSKPCSTASAPRPADARPSCSTWSGTVAEGDAGGYTASDIRFTKKGPTLYAIDLGWPKDRLLLIRSLASGRSGGKVESVRLLGHDAPLTWSRTSRGLEVSLSDDPPCDHAWVLRIEGDGLFPAPAEQRPPITPNADGRIFLGADAASIDGYSPQWKRRDQNDAVGRITGWRDGSQSVARRIEVSADGAYAVTATYGCQTDCAGGRFAITADGGDTAATGVIRGTGSWDEFASFSLDGSIRLAAGSHTIRFRPQFTGWNSLHLRSVELVPAR